MLPSAREGGPLAMPAAASGRVFISYRRQETSGMAGRLYDRLAAHLGEDQVFMDVDTIAPGVDFAEVITQAVRSCEALLAVIGPHWLTATDQDGRRRLDDPHDLVRLEVAAALEARHPRDSDSNRGRRDASPPGAARGLGEVGAPQRAQCAA